MGVAIHHNLRACDQNPSQSNHEQGNNPLKISNSSNRQKLTNVLTVDLIPIFVLFLGRNGRSPFNSTQ